MCGIDLGYILDRERNEIVTPNFSNRPSDDQNVFDRASIDESDGSGGVAHARLSPAE